MRAFVHPFRVAAVLLACAAGWLPGRALAQTPIRFVLEWKIDGTVAPLLVALDKGYFKAEGLSVTVLGPVSQEQGDIPNAAKRIAAGDAELGFGDLSLLLRARDQEPPAPVKAVFVLYNKPGYAVMGRKSRGIQTPGDLEGKKIGLSPRDPASALWKPFVTASAISADRITLENIGLPVRDPMLASGQIDAVTALSYYSYLDLKDRGVPANDITVIFMADYGVKLYGSSILASETFAQENPEAVRAFLRAFLKGLKDTIARPAQAIESVLKRDPSLQKDVELERLKLTIQDNIRTPETRTNGYGGMDIARMNTAIDQLAAAAEFKKKPKAEDIFDASFLPPPQQRKE
jgi:NitT/TauT family transport system substrate-binding protein